MEAVFYRAVYLKKEGCEILQRITANISLIRHGKYWNKAMNRQEEQLRIVSKAFAGVLNYLLCRISALKILQHMSERSEFVLQNLWF